MAESDIFLFLSSKAGERLPNVVKEAMLSGCICIVSNTPGIDELIEDGKTGFIIDKAQRELGYKPHSFREGLALIQSQLEQR